MHVVADASPLRYLILIGHSELLLTLFTQITIPGAVLGELQRAQTPPVVLATARVVRLLNVDVLARALSHVGNEHASV